MCTLLPNWGVEYDLNVGDSGFITIEYCKAGEKYYDRRFDQFRTIQYSNAYLKEFIRDNILENKKIIL